MAWQYVYFAEKRQLLDPKFDNCPEECPKAALIFSLHRFKFCGECPQKKAKDNFKRAAEEFFKQRLGPGKKYAFDDLLSVLYQVMNAEEKPKAEMSVKTYTLLGVYLQEKNRKQRIDDLARERKAKT